MTKWLLLGSVALGVIAALIARHREVRPAWPCAVMGHNDLLIFGTQGIWLRCDVCGKESPGWNLIEGRQELARVDGHS